MGEIQEEDNGRSMDVLDGVLICHCAGLEITKGIRGVVGHGDDPLNVESFCEGGVVSKVCVDISDGDAKKRL